VFRVLGTSAEVQLAMLNFFHSLSLESGALLVGLCSAAFAVLWAQIHVTTVRWLLVLGAPFVFSYCLYWAPVWLGANPSEYSSWVLAFIVPWYLIGTFLSVVVSHVIKKVRKPQDRFIFLKKNQ
jgi:hypothetical protein